MAFEQQCAVTYRKSVDKAAALMNKPARLKKTSVRDSEEKMRGEPKGEALVAAPTLIRQPAGQSEVQKTPAKTGPLGGQVERLADPA